MPAIVTTIDRQQREGLYELIRNHLAGIEDFFVALERARDFAKAERLALEFAEDFRLGLTTPPIYPTARYLCPQARTPTRRPPTP